VETVASRRVITPVAEAYPLTPEQVKQLQEDVAARKNSVAHRLYEEAVALWQKERRYKDALAILQKSSLKSEALSALLFETSEALRAKLRELRPYYNKRGWQKSWRANPHAFWR
jgi:chromosome segregation ATPase